MILNKTKSCLQKMEQGFWTYDLMRLLGSSDRNLISRYELRRDPKISYFFSDLYCDLGENKVLLVKTGAKVLDLWVDMPSGPNWSKCSLQVSDPQDQGIFHDFTILLDLSYDPEENQVMFVKTGTEILYLRLDATFAPKWSKGGLMAPDPKVRVLFEIHYFIGFIL